MNEKYVVILIRGLVGVRKDIRDCLFMMRLRKKFACTIIPKNKTNNGKLIKCKDYVTWGEIDSETEKMLIEKRGKKDKDGKMKKYFLLSPPKGGFERKGTKKPYSVGGALGYRKNKINDLLKKMI